MNEIEVLRLARDLVEKHLPGKTVTVGLSRTKKSIGDATYRPAGIRISKHWIPVMSQEEIVDIILHEIAHLIAGPRAGHGPEWKRVCREIGAKPYRLVSTNRDIEAKIHGICPTCNKVVARWHRMPSYRYVHSECKTELSIRRVS